LEDFVDIDDFGVEDADSKDSVWSELDEMKCNSEASTSV